jgi:hypothetical protein
MFGFKDMSVHIYHMCWEEVLIEGGGGKLDLSSHLATVFLLEVRKAPQITSQIILS